MEKSCTIEPKVVLSSSISDKGVKQNVFIYSILIKNNSENPISLTGRKWFISEKNGKTSTIDLENNQKSPAINPGVFFEYHGVTVTESEDSSMFGECTFQDLKTLEKFSISVPNIMLSVENKSGNIEGLRKN